MNARRMTPTQPPPTAPPMTAPLTPPELLLVGVALLVGGLGVRSGLVPGEMELTATTCAF